MKRLFLFSVLPLIIIACQDTPNEATDKHTVFGDGSPFITHMYTADPSARVIGDRLYVYPSHDEDTATSFSMQDWYVFSTNV